MEKEKTPEELYYAQLLAEFDLAVPRDYNHKTQLASFKEKNGKDFAVFNGMIPDSEFTDMTPLIPGKNYKVKIFQMTGGGLTQDFFKFLEHIKDLGAGPQGLTLAWQLMKEKFPQKIFYPVMSFTEKGAIYITRGLDSKWHFEVTSLLQEG